jgi:hypothetical protein
VACPDDRKNREQTSAACATVPPVVAKGAYVAFGGYKPLFWLLVAGSFAAAAAARQANRRLARS